MRTIPAICLLTSIVLAFGVCLAQEAPVPLSPPTAPPATAPSAAAPPQVQEADEEPPVKGTLPGLERGFPIPPDVKREIDRLFSIDPSERARACWNIGRIGPKAIHAIPFLLGLTADANIAWFTPDGKGRWTTPGTEAAFALGSIGEPALAFTMLLASSVRPTMRMNGALALGEIGNPAAVPTLVSLLNDPDWMVREQAAVALGKVKHPSAVEALTAALKDPEWKVRQAAIAALAATIAKSAVEAIIPCLDDRFPHVRQTALATLRALTGQSLGPDRAAWETWWREHGRSM